MYLGFINGCRLAEAVCENAQVALPACTTNKQTGWGVGLSNQHPWFTLRGGPITTT